MRVRVTAAALFLCAACSPGTVRVPWTVTFDSPSLAARAVRVLATLHEGNDCTGTVRYAVSIPHASSATTMPPAVTPGRYTVCADAIDDACTIFASGHTTVDLRGSPGAVDVLVVATVAGNACPGAACDHGDCVSLDGALPDGGTLDAGDLGFDAGDLGYDAGCTGHTVTAPTSPQCASFTQPCVDGCTDEPCYDACINADPSPTACGQCLDDAWDACANAAGCQSLYDAYYCCSLSCTSVPRTDPACCPPQQTMYFACTDPLTMCQSAQNVCYGL